MIDLNLAGRTLEEIAKLAKLRVETISMDHEAGLDEMGALMARSGRVAVESVARAQRRAQVLYGDRYEHTRHQRPSVGLQAERSLNDFLDSPSLLNAGSEQNRCSTYDVSWGPEPVALDAEPHPSQVVGSALHAEADPIAASIGLAGPPPEQQSESKEPP